MSSMSRNGEERNAAAGQPRPGRPLRGRPGQHGSLAWRVAAWVSVVLVAAMVTVSAGAYLKYRSVWGSIQRIEITGLGRQPPKYNNALNILLIGSDTRAGQNRQFGARIQGQRSDTIMLLHISPGRRGASVVSLPRDTVVPVLSCPAEGPGVPGQRAGPGQLERINQAYANGGPGCLWETAEHQTGVHIDHFIELTFTGFEHIVDDVGGVSICLPVAVDDPDSGLHLAAGQHHVMGSQALAFWRERHIGLGSDLQRIQRDQYLMAAIVRDVARSDLLGNPTRLYAVVRDAAGAMTTDTGLDQQTMLTIAGSLRGLSSRSVRFVTTPVSPYPGNPQAEVQFAQPQARALFRAIARDADVPAAPGRGVRRAVPRAHPPVPEARSAVPARPGQRAPGGLAKSYGGINGSARSCGDQAAFAGGDNPADFPSLP
ncbi:MAG TPA: LCP family protein [Streptosporangiaceae bacterium]|jgi:LCP family protein required for cell wall assembly